MPRARKWLRPTIELLLLLGVLYGVRAYQHAGIAEGVAPPLQGVLLDGDPVSLSRMYRQPVLVHFWASWCAVCAAEQANIADIAKDYPVITVAMRSGGKAEVQWYLRKHALALPVLNDPDGGRAARWGVGAVPASFIVEGGQIRFAEVGYTTEAGLRARLWLARH
jgi:thiol-disulfide isomerase/thioredoxin